MPSDTILYPRRMLYVEAVLYLVIAVASFGLGYLVGRGSPAKTTDRDKEDATIAKRVPIEGTVWYAPAMVPKSPDFDAAVIVVPAGKTPSHPLPFLTLLHAGDPGASASNPALNDLKALGGGFVRADANGHFTLFVPEPGSYRAFVISQRSTPGAGERPDPHDLDEIAKYFDSPTFALQRNKYKWLTWDVRPGASPQLVEFK